MDRDALLIRLVGSHRFCFPGAEDANRRSAHYAGQRCGAADRCALSSRVLRERSGDRRGEIHFAGTGSHARPRCMIDELLHSVTRTPDVTGHMDAQKDTDVNLSRRDHRRLRGGALGPASSFLPLSTWAPRDSVPRCYES